MLPPLVPETSASTNSATSAGVGRQTTREHYGITVQAFLKGFYQASLNAGRLDGLILTCQDAVAKRK